jgi:hypothetical protein
MKLNPKGCQLDFKLNFGSNSSSSIEKENIILQTNPAEIFE